MHFVPQQVDEVVSSISILCLDSLSAFARTHPLRRESERVHCQPMLNCLRELKRFIYYCLTLQYAEVVVCQQPII